MVFSKIEDAIEDIKEDLYLSKFAIRVFYMGYAIDSQFKMDNFQTGDLNKAKKLFDELGLMEPTTWEEFLNILDTVKEAGKIPLLSGNAQRWNIVNFYDDIRGVTVGREKVNELFFGDAKWTDPEFVAVWDPPPSNGRRQGFQPRCGTENPGDFLNKQRRLRHGWVF